LVTKGHVDLVREATGHMPEEVVFAGGASKSPLWCQILSDVLGLPVRVPVVREATALGAAILAGTGIGMYRDVAEGVEQCVRWDRTYRPDPENHRLYEEMFPVWREIYAAQLNLSDRGLTGYMWAAPGLTGG
ncbi:MAG: autoinducer-2 kinase, partial [Lachnospiraceae bacterium]|nr:autoinducer-2 kinase [Lachnospiraceae bacterium]